MHGHPGHNTQCTHLIATWFPRHGCMDDLKTEDTIDSQATWVINVLAWFSF